MKKEVSLLRFSYRVGAVADGFFALAMIFPKLWGMTLGLDHFSPILQHRLDMAVGASLMFSWTILLLWADRKPLERKGVLLLTVFPALLCLVITGIIAVLLGATSLRNILHVFLMQAALAVLFLTSYILARRAERAAARENAST